jgi:hypothetical protein
MKISEELLKKWTYNDPLLERNGRMFVNPSKWQVIAKSDDILWGLCKSMGSEFYQVKIDLISEKFDCNCPDSKKPCKHLIGLLFLDLAHHLQKNDFPEWVVNWLTNDRKNNQLPDFSEPKTSQVSEEQKIIGTNKRALERKELMTSGVDELELWLTDLVRQGFANLDIQNQEFWERAAIRFKDAKLSKVAFTLRFTGVIIRENKNWTELLCSTIGELAMLVQAFKNMDNFAADFQEEIFNAVGRIVKKTDLIDSKDFIIDYWTVIGLIEEINLDGILERRVWIQGQKSGVTALIQEFAFPPGTAFEHQYKLGKSYYGRLVFYPASFKQRSILLHSENNQNQSELNLKTMESFNALLLNYAQNVFLNPWIRMNCYIIENVKFFQDDAGKFFLSDVNSQLIEIRNEITEIWNLLSMSNAATFTSVLEWDANSAEILSVLMNNEVVEIKLKESKIV